MSQRTQITLSILAVTPNRLVHTLQQMLFVLVLVGATIAFTPHAAQADALPQPSAATTGPAGNSDTFLIHFNATSTPDERDAALTELNVELISWLPQIGVAEVRLAPTTATRQLLRSDEALAHLEQQWHTEVHTEAIITIEANVVVTGVDYPNDPDLLSADRSYAISVTHTVEGWEYTAGNAAIMIAVVDTGLNLNHPEFSGRVVAGYDFINNDADPMDDNGHGTHTAGIVAAGSNNGIGMVGVCPQCSIMPVKVLNQNNAGTWSSVAKGVLYAVDQGARVINLSLGAAVSSQTLEEAIAYATAHDVLVVAAAGNMGTDRKFYPAALDGVLAVSATDAQDSHWSLSNYGDYIDVAAPGYAIFSTYHDLSNYYQGYNYMSGTSMASPFVAGLAGLLLSQEAERTPADITKLITSTADKMGTSVDDAYFGHGRINVARALAVGADIEWTEVVEGEQTGGTGSGDRFSSQLFLPFVTR
jgi:subtilisin family serine protease